MLNPFLAAHLLVTLNPSVLASQVVAPPATMFSPVLEKAPSSLVAEDEGLNAISRQMNQLMWDTLGTHLRTLDTALSTRQRRNGRKAQSTQDILEKNADEVNQAFSRLPEQMKQ